MVSTVRPASRAFSPQPPFPRQLAAGLLLIALAWPVAWFGPERPAEFSFFPLWLGYILTVDGIVERRTGSSLLRRGPTRFAALFLVSIPIWWLYEALNERLGNWQYLYPREVGFFVRHARASIAFSTVVPALFETADLFRSIVLHRRIPRWIRISLSPRSLFAVSALGVLMIALCLVFPRQAFPLVWLGFFFLIDPIVGLLGGRSISAQVARGHWNTVIALFCAGLTCGFFWEMWNFWSMPKWIYHIPYLDWPKIFEMPLMGYGGYLPFALEVYATIQAVDLLARFIPPGYLRFDEVEEPAPSREP